MTDCAPPTRPLNLRVILNGHLKSPDVIKALDERGCDVATTYAKEQDSDLLDRANSERRILITSDRGFNHPEHDGRRRTGILIIENQPPRNRAHENANAYKIKLILKSLYDDGLMNELRTDKTVYARLDLDDSLKCTVKRPSPTGPTEPAR